MTMLADTSSWTPAAVEGLITSLVTAAVTIFGLWKSMQAAKQAAVAETKSDANTSRLDLHADHINQIALNTEPGMLPPLPNVAVPAMPPPAFVATRPLTADEQKMLHQLNQIPMPLPATTAIPRPEATTAIPVPSVVNNPRPVSLPKWPMSSPTPPARKSQA